MGRGESRNDSAGGQFTPASYRPLACWVSVLVACLVLPSSPRAAGPSSGQYVIQSSVVGTGGGAAASGSFATIATAGTPGAGDIGSGAHQSHVGFYVPGEFIPTDVELVGQALPKQFRLHQNNPNPFNPRTTIAFDLPEAAHVTLEVWSVSGRRVKTLANRTFTAGVHHIVFDAQELPSGVYWYRIDAGGFVDSKRLALIK